MARRKFKKTVALFIIIFVILLVSTAITNAAPTGKMGIGPDGSVTSETNMLVLGGTESITVWFRNDAGAAITDVASTVQYVKLACVNLSPTHAEITGTAAWEIWTPDGLGGHTLRTSGTLSPSINTNIIYSPYSTSALVTEYDWAIPQTITQYTDSSQFFSSLAVLRPMEYVKLTVTIHCLAVGDDRMWFFFRSTEDHHTSDPTSINDITDKANIYYKSPSWYPLHNSYDPNDATLSTGHSFKQTSWTIISTTTQFAKANKLIHQAPANAFHICGLKYGDANVNDVYDPGIDPLINGKLITLLGADMATDALVYYSGKLSLMETHGNPIVTGEGGEALDGTYCFNLIDVNPGTYVFYLRLEEPTPKFIGPITLSTSGQTYSTDNNFANAVPEFPIPEYTFGALLAIAACFAAFAISKKLKINLKHK